VDYALKRKQTTDSPIKDKRGKGTYHNKTPEVDIERIHAHFDSFPAMEYPYFLFVDIPSHTSHTFYIYLNCCSGIFNWNLFLHNVTPLREKSQNGQRDLYVLMFFKGRVMRKEVKKERER
jgi:hypothetical protein